MVVLHTVLLILIGLFALPWVQGAWAGPSTDQLCDGIDRVVKILRDPELRGDTKVNERRVAVNKVADEIFDFGETAKRSLGQHWPSERRLEFPRRSANSMRESLGRTARSRSDWGIVRPSALGVLRLMTSSNLLGCSTGRSAGLAPF
jgi:hypothetical protein